MIRKTALGQQVMKDRSVSLTGQQRSALILVDGKRSVEDILKATGGIGVNQQDLEALETLGLIEQDAQDIAVAAPTISTASSTAASAADSSGSAAMVPSALQGGTSSAGEVNFQEALNAAITVCADLGFKGFSLNMALTGVDSLEKLQRLAPEIRRVAGDKKYAPLHTKIFGSAG
jgi:hypothetical protein